MRERIGTDAIECILKLRESLDRKQLRCRCNVRVHVRRFLVRRDFYWNRRDMAFGILGVQLRFDDGAKVGGVSARERHFASVPAKLQCDRQAIADWPDGLKPVPGPCTADRVRFQPGR